MARTKTSKPDIAAKVTRTTSKDPETVARARARVMDSLGVPRPRGRVRKVLELQNVGAANYGTLFVTIVGTTPLIVNRFPPKEIMAIAEKQQGSAKTARKKAPRVPEDECVNALYFLGKRASSLSDLKKGKFAYGFPAAAFRQVMARVSSLNKMLPMTEVRQVALVQGDPRDMSLVEIKTPKPPRMQEDVVRVKGTDTQIRYRPVFEEWSMDLEIEFHARIITAQQIVSLLIEGGIGVGVGEWRPCGKASSGTYGTWKVTKATAEVPDLD